MSINAILAMDDNLGIGIEGKLPWPHNKKDMQWFRDNTSEHVVVMGRRTWESFGCKKLPNRINVVVTNREVEGEPDRVERGEMVEIISTVACKYSNLDIWIIGGSDLYRQALPYCDKLYVTRIKGVYKCDTFMYNSDFEGFDVLEYVDEDDDMIIQVRSR